MLMKCCRIKSRPSIGFGSRIRAGELQPLFYMELGCAILGCRISGRSCSNLMASASRPALPCSRVGKVGVHQTSKKNKGQMLRQGLAM